MSESKPRARYTLEFKLEAVRLVKGGQVAAVTAKILGIPKQTLENWVRLANKGQLKGAGDKLVSPECWRQRCIAPGCQFPLTHLIGQEIRTAQRFHTRGSGAIKVGTLGQKVVGTNSEAAKLVQRALGLDQKRVLKNLTS